MVLNHWDDKRLMPFFDFQARCAAEFNTPIGQALQRVTAEAQRYELLDLQNAVSVVCLGAVDYWMSAWIVNQDVPDDAPIRRSKIRFWTREECNLVARHFRAVFMVHVEEPLPFELARVSAGAAIVEYAVRIGELDFANRLFETIEARWFDMVRASPGTSLTTQTMFSRLGDLHDILRGGVEWEGDALEQAFNQEDAEAVAAYDSFPPITGLLFPANWTKTS
jgi:hypothetical protein